MKPSKRLELLEDLSKLVPRPSLDRDTPELTWETPDGMAFTVSLAGTYRAYIEDAAGAAYLMDVLRMNGMMMTVHVEGSKYVIGDRQAMVSSSLAIMSSGWIKVDGPSFAAAVVQFYVRAMRRKMTPPPAQEAEPEEPVNPTGHAGSKEDHATAT